MAEQTEIMDAIEALAVHCRPPVMSVEGRSRWLMDWCTDLRDYPLSSIERATTRWRQGEDRKFPTPGQLLPMVRAAMPTEAETQRIQEWRPLSDEEYRNLSVREKIRHRTILATQARCRGGPMFRNTGKFSGDHLSAEQMPAKWHEAQREAAVHEDEIRRLRGYIQPMEQAA